MKKILFLTTAHRDDDDRIFHHQAKSFLDSGYKVKISSLSSSRKGLYDGIEVESYPILKQSSNEKIETFGRIIEDYTPDMIIASEPLAVVAAKEYKRKNKIPVVYDITEWYPSMRMVAGHSFVKKIILTIKLFIIQLYAGHISTAFIFGEKTKYFPLYYLFFWKRNLLLPYFPLDKYIYYKQKRLDKHNITLAYTGIFSEDKGLGNFLKVAYRVQQLRPEITVKILLIGRTNAPKDEVYLQDKLAEYSFKEIEIRPPVPLEDFSYSIRDADICFDLRALNFENHHCLPIKIFYYAASGKPVIYTKLKAIKTQVKYSDFAFLVNPKDYEEIANIVINITGNENLYNKLSLQARQLFIEQYNWAALQPELLAFTENLIKNK